MRHGHVWFGLAGKFRCGAVRSGVDRFGMAGWARLVVLGNGELGCGQVWLAIKGGNIWSTNGKMRHG